MRRCQLKPYKKQRGVMIIAAVLVAISIAITFSTLFIKRNDQAYNDFYQSDESRSILMSEIKSQIQKYYIANSNDLSKNDLPNNISKENILNQLSIPKNSSAKINIGITNIKSNDKFQWRDIYAWIPATDGFDESVFNPSGNQKNNFIPGDGVSWTAFSGQPVEAQNFSQASDQIEYVAGVIRSMYASRVGSDPLRDQSANYFADCGPRPTYARNIHTLSCSGSGDIVSLDSLGASESIGLSNNDFINPWGKNIQASNTTGTINLNNESHTISSNETPYNMILTSQTPTGYVIFRYIIQPL